MKVIRYNKKYVLIYVVIRDINLITTHTFRNETAKSIHMWMPF